MPAALKLDWDMIRECAVAGVSFNDLARKFNLLMPDGSPDTRALRKRAERYSWPIPSVVAAKAKRDMAHARLAQMEAQKSQGIKPEEVSRSVVSRVVTPLDVAAESIATYGERSRLAILAGMTPQIASAMAQPEAFRPKNVKELVQVGAMIHKLSGLDQSGNVAVNLNLWSDPARSNPALSGELYEVSDAQEAESEVIQPE